MRTTNTGFAKGHTQALALPDRKGFDTRVLSQDLTVGGNKIPSGGCTGPGADKVLMFTRIHKTDLLAIAFVRYSQSSLAG